ncbi:nucleotidyltransferase domain-containing protein [Chitinophaga arvensicola]|uniref:Nucleotidyltransferase n=1 Tax=Chitinophaga arvensicola TaxID=29529 RepID=A0A1I0S859_9BACT|nr:nucleotidyltransferase [Chitinophaga arvensicola]SEW51884.1 hypothetical protein SAMN04488122_4564 [Chitinophaga arvensicola]
MLIFKEKNTQLDDLLDKMAESIQLNRTRKEKMEEAYAAVCNWLKDDDEFFKDVDFEVYPQGSVKTGTTIRPNIGDEFDLDIVVHLQLDWQKHTPSYIYNQLKRRLMASGTYAEMIELKNRCIRLNYAGEFHMDILPGCQRTYSDEDRILVPDRALGKWTPSSPRAYAKWFIDRANSIETSLLEKAYSLEDLPPDSFMDKKPLQRAVQLIKKARDVFFDDDEDYAPSSIILTTLAGHYYQNDDSIFGAISGIMTGISQLITSSKDSQFKLYNPVDITEEFTDKWNNDKKHYTQFKLFVNHFNSVWSELQTGRLTILQEDELIKSLFGDAAYDKAIRLQAELVEKYRANQKLLMEKKTGILTSASVAGTIPVPKNTFDGRKI